jgi:hypothetical protein
VLPGISPEQGQFRVLSGMSGFGDGGGAGLQRLF